jgi:hypothetical protein
MSFTVGCGFGAYDIGPVRPNQSGPGLGSPARLEHSERLLPVVDLAKAGDAVTRVCLKNHKTIARLPCEVRLAPRFLMHIRKPKGAGGYFTGNFWSDGLMVECAAANTASFRLSGDEPLQGTIGSAAAAVWRRSLSSFQGSASEWMNRLKADT